jgi:LPXTG-motif cell wall-anchored protein
VQLVDLDGNSIYTGNTTVKVTVNPDGTTQPTPIAIFGGVGMNSAGTGPGSKLAGYSSLVVKDFGHTVIEDSQTLKAEISFDGDQGGDTMPGLDNGDETKTGDAKSLGGASVTKVLPNTGGALPILGAAGALLVASGLIVHRRTR